MKTPRLFLLLAALAFLAYAPVLSFPFIGDSFADIPLSNAYGSWAALPKLMADPAWHFRLSYVFANSWIASLFDFIPRPFYLASICFHIVCVWLVYYTGNWSKIGMRVSSWAAAVFAVYAGHDDAVMRLAGWPQLFLAVFAIVCFVLWTRWLRRRKWWLYAGAMAAYLAALFSQPTACFVAGLLLLPLLVERALWRRGLLSYIPFAAITAGYFGFLRPPLVIRPLSTLVNSSGALFIILAVAAIIFLAVARAHGWWRIAGLTLIAMVIALLPYDAQGGLSAPGARTYLASVGLALLIGFALAHAQERFSLNSAVAAVCLICLTNIALLWTTKRREYLALAEPTQSIIKAAAQAQTPLRLSCFPYPLTVAQGAAIYGGGRVVLDGNAQKIVQPHCLSFSYLDVFGSVRHITMRTKY